MTNENYLSNFLHFKSIISNFPREKISYFSPIVFIFPLNFLPIGLHTNLLPTHLVRITKKSKQNTVFAVKSNGA